MTNIRIPLVYIAGKFRGPTAWDIEQNVRLAESFALEVAKLGGMPMCPHTNTRFFQGAAGLADEFWLSGTMAMAEVCRAIVMIPGWTESTGAKAERSQFILWNREHQIYYLDKYDVKEVSKNADYPKLQRMIVDYKSS